MDEEKQDDTSDEALADLGVRIRRAQRRNMMVRLGAVIVVISGFVIGLVFRSMLEHRGAGLQWAGLIVGLTIAGFMVRKLEVQVDDIE